MPTYYSQVDQDRILNEEVFCGMRNGVFVDVGAHDGISLSNTLMFEREFGWTGLCIEPNPDVFPLLIENRSAVCLEIAIAKRDGRLPFIKVDGNPQMLSGLSQSMDTRHRERIERETKEHNTSHSVMEVNVRPLASVLSEHRISEIHYLSIDTEGNETDVLASIDFHAVMIHAITVEANYYEARDEIDAILFRRFDLVGQHEQDLYFINRRSPFISKTPGLRAVMSSTFKPYRVRQFRRLAGRVARSIYPKFRYSG
jgi:FkbM family methyltransferase